MLILHGISDLPNEMVQDAVAKGVTKLNIDMELKLKFREGIEAVWSEGNRHLEAATF